MAGCYCSGCELTKVILYNTYDPNRHNAVKLCSVQVLIYTFLTGNVHARANEIRQEVIKTATMFHPSAFTSTRSTLAFVLS